MIDRALGASEIDLLRTMVEADEAASREGLRDEPFRVLMFNRGETLLEHKGIGAERRPVSRRAFLGLREAGLFVLVSETRHLVRVYLGRDARKRLEDSSTALEPKAARRPGRPSGPYLIQSREEIEVAYRSLWEEAGRRPTWSKVALRLDVDELTLRKARRAFQVDAGSIQLEIGE